ncbi:MAG: hypothetical protein KGO96_09455 [Elusimicrobia bacterium]|nr:hypothetical protein [Elusimicrobiota bacterium]MDE2236817.1 hypothetical protein [Elusimicrobiota bacterium]MDE2426115.1 hypothetical protein [Elusimicrobiota bacterium]
MARLLRFLFVKHWLASAFLLPWPSLAWCAVHLQWLRLLAVLAYLELVGGPLALLD